MLGDQKIISESFYGIFYTKINLHPTPPHNNHAFWHVDISCVGVEENMVQDVKTENDGYYCIDISWTTNWWLP